MCLFPDYFDPIRLDNYQGLRVAPALNYVRCNKNFTKY